jgi:hypothetical protein
MGRSVLFTSHGFPTLELVPAWDVGNVWKHGNVHFFLWSMGSQPYVCSHMGCGEHVEIWEHGFPSWNMCSHVGT